MRPTVFSISALILFALNLATYSKALARDTGGNVGNGGDVCENRIKVVSDDIASWLVRGGGESLILPQGASPAQYATAMKASIQAALVSCLTSSILIGGSEKTCKNFVDGQGQRRIQCNSARTLALSESDLYILVHHEFAGLSGFEVNGGESSQYPISNQITAYLENQVVKKLAIKRHDPQPAFDSRGFASIQDVRVLDGLREKLAAHVFTCVDTIQKTRWQIARGYPFNESMHLPESLMKFGVYTLYQHQSLPLITYVPPSEERARKEYESKCGATWEETQKRCPNFSWSNIRVIFMQHQLPTGMIKFGLTPDHADVLTIEYSEDRYEDQVVQLNTSITNPEGQTQTQSRHIQQHWICRRK
jgi:hypothetical protein